MKLIFGFLFVVLLLTGAYAMDAEQCHSQWSKSGMLSTYGPIQGCLIQMPDKTWIPADRYRNVN